MLLRIILDCIYKRKFIYNDLAYITGTQILTVDYNDAQVISANDELSLPIYLYAFLFRYLSFQLPLRSLTFNSSISRIQFKSCSHKIFPRESFVPKKGSKIGEQSGIFHRSSSTPHASSSRFSGSETIARRGTSCNTEASFSLWHAIHSTFLSPFPTKGILDANVSCASSNYANAAEHAEYWTLLLRKCRVECDAETEGSIIDFSAARSAGSPCNLSAIYTRLYTRACMHACETFIRDVSRASVKLFLFTTPSHVASSAFLASRCSR